MERESNKSHLHSVSSNPKTNSCNQDSIIIVPFSNCFINVVRLSSLSSQKTGIPCSWLLWEFIGLVITNPPWSKLVRCKDSHWVQLLLAFPLHVCSQQARRAGPAFQGHHAAFSTAPCLSWLFSYKSPCLPTLKSNQTQLGLKEAWWTKSSLNRAAKHYRLRTFHCPYGPQMTLSFGDRCLEDNFKDDTRAPQNIQALGHTKE